MLLNISSKTYSFRYDVSVNPLIGTYNTGLFIPGGTILMTPMFIRGEQNATSATNSALFDLGWTANISILFTSYPTGILTNATIFPMQFLTQAPFLIPAGGVEIILTITIEALITGKGIFIFPAYEI